MYLFCGKRNAVIAERIHLMVLLLAILSDSITKSEVVACREWQQCMSLSECRKIQKQFQIQTDFSSSLLYPCDEQLRGRICCTIKPAEEKEEEGDPGYTITYGDSPQASEVVAVPLPFKESGQIKNAEICGVYQKSKTLEDASIMQFPWLALIGNDDSVSRSIQFKCGGTLINYQYVLTSASCINSTESPPVMVRLGEYDISKEEDCEFGCTTVDSEVEKIIVHQSYDYPYRKNDIALLKLKGPLPKDKENIMPICLPVENVQSEVYTVAGWGINDQRNFTVIPKYGTLSLDTAKLCEADLPIPLQPVGEKQLCSKKIRGSCFGDGGGPLMAFTNNEDRAVLAGIISQRSPQCNSPFATDLFTNVYSYLDWITENTRE